VTKSVEALGNPAKGCVSLVYTKALFVLLWLHFAMTRASIYLKLHRSSADANIASSPATSGEEECLQDPQRALHANRSSCELGAQFGLEAVVWTKFDVAWPRQTPRGLEQMLVPLSVKAFLVCKVTNCVHRGTPR